MSIQTRRYKFNDVSISIFAAMCLLSPLHTYAKNPLQITLGYYLALTGPLADIGREMQQGAKLAVDHANASGDYKVNALYANTQGNPSTGVAVARQLATQGSDLLIGGTSSAVVLALAAQAERLNLPIVTTDGNDVAITGSKCSKYVFRTLPNDAMIAKSTELFILKEPKLKNAKWAIIYADYAWGQSSLASFKAIPDINIVSEIGRRLGTTDWASALTEIKESGATALQIATLGADNISLSRQYPTFGLNLDINGVNGSSDTQLQVIGESAVGMTSAGLQAPWTMEKLIPDLKSFNQAYYERYQEPPTIYAIETYVGTQFVLQAAKNAKSLSTQDLIEAMETTTADTALGPLKIRPEDHQAQVGLGYGRVVQVDPEDSYGAKYAFALEGIHSWDQVKVPIEDTGCNMK